MTNFGSKEPSKNKKRLNYGQSRRKSNKKNAFVFNDFFPTPTPINILKITCKIIKDL
jgi:hypothetical protein